MTQEPCCWAFYEERSNNDLVEGITSGHLLKAQQGWSTDKIYEESIPAEAQVYHSWIILCQLGESLIPQSPTHAAIKKCPSLLNELLAELDELHSRLTLMSDGSRSCMDGPLEERPFPALESQVSILYGHLEVLQCVCKACDMLDRKRKTPPFKGVGTDKILKNLSDKASAMYKTIQEFAQAWINHYKKHGMRIVKAQARHGSVGEALKTLISDDELEVMAKVYVDGLIDTLSGVLMVKLYRK